MFSRWPSCRANAHAVRARRTTGRKTRGRAWHRAALYVELLEGRTLPAVLTVNSLNDAAVDLTDATVTLRDAIQAANNDVEVTPGGQKGSGADEIKFQAGLTGTITLTQGELLITSDLTITGPVTSPVTVSGNNASRVFNVDDGTANVKTVVIKGLTISAGLAANYGGGIFNRENVTVQNSALSGNVSATDGGGILNLGTMTVQNSTISGNSAGSGGGIENRGTLTVQNSTISGNSAAIYGGGIFNLLSGTLTVQNSTLSGNSAGNGGGIRNQAGSILLHNTIVADNFKGSGSVVHDDVNGAVESASSHNLIGVDTGLTGISNGTNGNQIGTAAAPIDPRLGPLTNNGGPTETRNLLARSPAINAGNNARAAGSFDQRGDPFIRIADTTVDIGAFERQPRTFVVDITDDVSDGNFTVGNLSLREAVEQSNLNDGADIILFSPAVFGTAKTITLAPDPITMQGRPLTITDDLTITGPGAGLLTVSGNDAARVFNVDDAAPSARTVAISNLTITEGNAGAEYGGGIRNLENLTVQNSTLSGHAGFHGGGIYNSGTMTVQNSTVSGNSATGSFSGGAGIFNAGSGTMTVQNSTLSGNSATYYGGGIFSSGTMTVQNSTISGNSALGGGGIENYGTMTVQNSTLSDNSTTRSGGGIENFLGTITVQNSTLSDNSALFDGGGIYNWPNSTVAVQNSTLSGNLAARGGGGIFNRATLTVRNSTITQNHADNDGNSDTETGGGIHGFGTGSTVTLHNTIVAQNFNGSGTDTRDDVTGTLDSASGHNLIGVDTGLTGISNGTKGNQIGTAAAPINPKLGPLADNGGPTQTHALLADSPALHAGNPAEFLPTDQRGIRRPRGAGPDIGAFEVATILSNGDLLVFGTPEADTITIQANADPGKIDVLFEGVLGGSFAQSAITGHIVVEGGGGNDFISIAAGIDKPGQLLGGGGNDTLVGGGGADSMNGSIGNDSLVGGAGNDTLIGGRGNDTSNGGAGVDLVRESFDVNLVLANSSLTGDLGSDTLLNIETAKLTGGASSNTLDASAFTLGPVTLDGGLGNDFLKGGGGNDSLSGNQGSDFLTGNAGNDTLNGGDGSDRVVENGSNLTLTNSSLTGVGSDVLLGINSADLTGTTGNDNIDARVFGAPTTLTGLAGNDIIRGGIKDDRIDGGNGNDIISGGAGNDTIDGAAGIDRFFESVDVSMTLASTSFSAVGRGTDVLSSFEQAVLTSGVSANTLDASGFTAGSATLNGGSGGDVLRGGSGNDSLFGGDGNDRLEGNGGNDTLDGGAGTDTGIGGAGTDVFVAVESQTQ